MLQHRHSSSAAQCINEHLLGKVGKFIHKREKLLGNMNQFCLKKTVNVIDETESQLPANEKLTMIPTVFENGQQKMDNLMSIPDANVTMLNIANRSFYSMSSISQEKRPKRQLKQRRISLVQPKSGSSGPTEIKQKSSLSHDRINESQLIVLPKYRKQEEEEDKYVDILRLTKKLEMQQEQRRRKLEQQELKHKKPKVSYSNHQIMYDYNGKITKIDQKKTSKISQINQLRNKVVSRQEVVGKGGKSQIILVQNPKNITQKQIQAQQNKLRKHLKPREDGDFKIPTYSVNLSHQTHEITQNAFEVGGQGIKIKIQNRVLSKKKSKLKTETKITRRLSKSQFIEFKKEQSERKKKTMLRLKSEQNKRTQNFVSEQVEVKKFSTNRMFTLTSNRKSSSDSQSRIVILNQRRCFDLLREEKQQKQLNNSQFTPTKPTNSQRQCLSSIDRYNLMYLKYNGNPPGNIEEVTKELRMASKKSLNLRTNPQTQKKKKYSWVGDSRLVSNRFVDASRRLKTQN